jgi:hypothetical protein
VHFDPDWERHGHMEDARRLAVDWLREHPLPGSVIHDLMQPGRSPLILVEVPGGLDQTVLI